MGNLYDYFAAPGDAVALTAFPDGPKAAGLDVLETKGIDPFVQLGAAEALLRGADEEAVAGDPRHGHLLSDPDAESCWLVTLTDALRDALAAAGPRELAAVAGPWSAIEEFGDGVAAQDLAAWLTDLATVASRAREREHRLYCLVQL